MVLEGRKKTMEQIRLGVIGLGSMGRKYCESIAAGKVPEIRITAVTVSRQSGRDWVREHLPEDTMIFADGDR